VAVSGALQDLQSGKIAPGSTVVCTLTGHGLKDPDVAIAHSGAPVLTVKAHKDAVRSAIAGGLE
jgi:threonine synthase